MIERVLKGDLLTSRAQTLINTVNTVGVMGKGIALQFRRRFPEMYADYRDRCAAGAVRLGEPYLYQRPDPPWIINFPTKDHWRSLARLDAIDQGLEFLVANLERWRVESLAVPPLGTGNGRLEWTEVGPLIYRRLKDVPIPVELYAPFNVPDDHATPAFLEARADAARHGSPIPVGWLAIAEIVDRIERAQHAWPVGRTRFQKLVYFATAAGVPTGAAFQEDAYGPFAPSLNRELTSLVNLDVLVEERSGRLLRLVPGPALDDLRGHHQEQLARFRPAIDRVSDLLIRLDGPGTELTGSIHYAAMRLASELGRAPTEREVLAKVQAWKRRRQPQFAPADIGDAIRDLAMLGWIEVASSGDLPAANGAATVA